MDDLRQKFISGNNAEMKTETLLTHHDVYCESQNVSDNATKEEQEEVKIKENKKKPFIANYNTFF